MDDLGILIKNGKLQVIKRNMYPFVNNAYILLSVKLTEQKKNIALYIVLPKIQSI